MYAYEIGCIVQSLLQPASGHFFLGGGILPILFRGDYIRDGSSVVPMIFKWNEYSLPWISRVPGIFSSMIWIYTTCNVVWLFHLVFIAAKFIYLSIYSFHARF